MHYSELFQSAADRFVGTGYTNGMPDHVTTYDLGDPSERSVEDILNDIPVTEVTWENMYQFSLQLQRAANSIARKTMRGIGRNILIRDRDVIVYYRNVYKIENPASGEKAISDFDVPIIVNENCVFLNNNYQDYFVKFNLPENVSGNDLVTNEDIMKLADRFNILYDYNPE